MRWVLECLVKPVVVCVGTPVERAYNLFSWERAVRSSIGRENQLSSEIKQELPFLFSAYAGTIVPIESIEMPVPKSLQHPRPFGYAVVIVKVDDVLFRFIRGRGELAIQITRKCNPKDWGELPSILHWLGWHAELERPRDFASLQDAAEVLRPRMDLLLGAYSEHRYSETRRRVEEARDEDRAAARQLGAEINRRLHG
jgi:hypothetical protein